MPNKLGRPDPKYTESENISGVEFLPEPLKSKILEQKRHLDEINKFRRLMSGYSVTIAGMPEPGSDSGSDPGTPSGRG